MEWDGCSIQLLHILQVDPNATEWPHRSLSHRDHWMVKHVSIHWTLKLLDFDICGSCMFDNKYGKLGPNIAAQLKNAEWHLFLRRQTKHKTEKRVKEATRIEALHV